MPSFVSVTTVPNPTIFPRVLVTNEFECGFCFFQLNHSCDGHHKGRLWTSPLVYFKLVFNSDKTEHHCCRLTHLFALGIVHIGKGLEGEAPFSGDSKRSSTPNKSPQSPPRNQEMGKFFGTDFVFCALHMYFLLRATDYIVFLSVTRGDAGKDGKD